MGFEPDFSVAAPATCPVVPRARIRLCRLPTGSPSRRQAKEDQVRDIGLDVHRDFCEVAISEAGEIRSEGRIQTTPQALELFAGSLGRDDQVALEVTGDAWEIARIIEPHVGAGDRRQPHRYRDPPGAGEDRPPRRAGAGQALGHGLAGGALDAGRADASDAPAPAATKPADQGPHPRQERDPRGAGPPADRQSPRSATCSEWPVDAGSRASSCPREERETVDSCLRQVDFLEGEFAEADGVIAADALASSEVRRLMSVPGVNVVTAAAFMAAIGEAPASDRRGG